MSSITHARLNIEKVPPIVGEESKKRLFEYYRLLKYSKVPLYLVGPSGSGKSATGKALVKMYAKDHSVPGYYFTLSQEDTKTSVLLGLRLQDGSLIPVNGVLAQAAEESAVVFIDEITQSTHNMLTMLTAVDGSESVISIGDKIIDASRLRVIYGSNRATYSSNIRVPQAFANRVLALPFDYPSWEDEVAITLEVAKKDSLIPITVPDALAKYAVSYMRDNREELLPLSVRNAAKVVIWINLLLAGKKINDKIDAHFTSSSNVDSIRKMLTRRILNRPPSSSTEISSKEVLDFCRLVSTVGIEKVKEIFLACANYHIDIDGLEQMQEPVRQKLAGSII